MTERVAPHSLEAERAVLGAVLLSEQAWPKASSSVRAGDFFREAHRQIFEAMRAVAERGEVIDYVTLGVELKKRGQHDEVGGGVYIQGLVDGVPRSANVDHYAGVVREKARLRAAIDATNELLADSFEETATVSLLVERFSRRLLALVGTARAEAVRVGVAVKSYVAALQSGEVRTPVPTGYADVDKIIDGMRPQDLVIIAARPSAGKTSLALGIALSIAAASVASGSRKAVLFFSLEMGVDGIVERLVGWHADVAVAVAARGEATLDQYAAVIDAVAGYEHVPLRIETSAATLVEIDAWCRRVEHEEGLSAVVVDYIQLLSSDTRQSSQEAEVAAFSKGLKRLAKAVNVPMIALSQLSRAPEGRADKRPQTADLRGSGALEQDADMVLLIHRPEMYQRSVENDGVAELIVSKNRQGPTGIARLHFQKEVARFRDLRPHDQQGEEG